MRWKLCLAVAGVAIAGCGGLTIDGTGLEAGVMFGSGVTSASVVAYPAGGGRSIDLGPCLGQTQCITGRNVPPGNYHVVASAGEGSGSDAEDIFVPKGQVVRVILDLR